MENEDRQTDLELESGPEALFNSKLGLSEPIPYPRKDSAEDHDVAIAGTLLSRESIPRTYILSSAGFLKNTDDLNSADDLHVLDGYTLQQTPAVALPSHF